MQMKRIIFSLIACLIATQAFSFELTATQTMMAADNSIRMAQLATPPVVFGSSNSQTTLLTFQGTAMTANAKGSNSYTVITKIGNSAVTKSGSNVSFTLSSAGTTTSVTAMYVCNPTVTWQCNASISQLFVGNVSSFTIPIYPGTITTDKVAFGITANSPFTVAWNVGTTSNIPTITVGPGNTVPYTLCAGNVTCYITYYKAGVAEAGSGSGTRGASYLTQGSGNEAYITKILLQ